MPFLFLYLLICCRGNLDVRACDRPRSTQGLPGPSGPEPQKSPERVPQGRAPKVPKEWSPKSQKSAKRVRKSGFRLFSDSFETPRRTLSALLGPCPGVLFPDSFRTLPGFRARRAEQQKKKFQKPHLRESLISPKVNAISPKSRRVMLSPQK